MVFFISERPVPSDREPASTLALPYQVNAVLCSEAQEWSQRHLRYSAIASWEADGLRIYFDDAEDAVLFKLKWLARDSA